VRGWCACLVARAGRGNGRERGIRQPEPVKMGRENWRRARRVRRGSERSGSEGKGRRREPRTPGREGRETRAAKRVVAVSCHPSCV
jgi:hypothetical protein